MKISLSILTITIGIILITSNLFSRKTEDHSIRHQMFVFGTVVDIVLWTDDKSAANQAVTEIKKELNKMHYQWHAWKPGRLMDINTKLRAGKSVNLSNDEYAVLQKSILLSKQSDGLFNPVMGEVIHLWGFHSDEYPLTEPPPKKQAIDALLAEAPQTTDLIWTGQKLHSQNRHVWFDLGGLAKGYAVDQAAKIIRSYGIKHAIINAGGDLLTLGQKGNTPWVIGIQSPKDSQVLASLEAKNNEAIFTSGNYQRFKAFNGKRYAHIIDPRNYWPVNHIISATVISDNGMHSDAAATALVVAGKNWFQIAQKLNIKNAVVVDVNNQCYATKPILKRLKNLQLKCQIPQPQAGGL